MQDANPNQAVSATTVREIPPAALAARLLDWYDQHRRRLPWRAQPDERPDPYRVWLSEIMLQQTTVAAVGRYFRRFIELWPTVRDLAAAPREAVLAEWAGLGYYARARNLHACARVVSDDFGGRFPETESALLELPGIGAYTAAAIAAIAFDRRATVLDGNVERVIARLHLVTDPLPAAKPRLRALASTITPELRPGDYAQAVMDLGATVCTPRAPKCLMCPWAEACRARASGIAETLPRKLRKQPKSTRHGGVFFVVGGDGSLLLRRRPDKGLLGGMVELPTTDWTETPPDPEALRQAAPVATEWSPLGGTVRHTFTHFHLELSVMAGRLRGLPAVDGHYWVPIDEIGAAGLPTVMVKVVKHAAKGLSG